MEGLTQVRIDHFAVIDFAGFQQMVDAIGGIDLQNSAGGVDHLYGREALAYVSGGGSDPTGYLDRLRRQQNALRGLLDKAVAGGALADPAKLIALLDSLSHTMSLDETLGNATLLGLALQMPACAPRRCSSSSRRSGHRAGTRPRGHLPGRRAVGRTVELAARRHGSGLPQPEPR